MTNNSKVTSSILSEQNEDYLEEDLDEQEEKSSHSGLKDKNYITPEGLKNLKDEYAKLKYGERPEVCKTVQWAAENGDRSENADYTYGKRRLRQIDKRLGFLGKRIRTAEVIDPKLIKSDEIQFGATVTFLNEDDLEKTYTIVGADEVDVSNKKISWLSPLAQAMMGKKQGDIVTFKSPKGLQEIEILKIIF
jgi:transcription elongation factor GreB